MVTISVQCGRELNFLHSDITVIILHGQILILYNWRPYLSITPRTSLHWKQCCHIAHNNEIFRILTRYFSKEQYVLPEDDMRHAIETCWSILSVLV